MTDEHLDDPVWASLTGPHAALAETCGRAMRYPGDVSPFVALPPDAGTADWADLATLVGPGGQVGRIGAGLGALPDGWTLKFEGCGLQLVATDALTSAPYDEAVVLTESDVDEMMALVALTQPGPFARRTRLMGTYLGVRRDGRLAAMAGERLHPPGWTEISAVCTHPDARGQGLGSALVKAVAHTIRERGETPFLHVAGTNTGALRLYEALGFRVRSDEVRFFAAAAPG